MTQPEKTHLTFRLDRDLERKLKEIAERNERSVGAEIRLAIRRHVEALGAAA